VDKRVAGPASHLHPLPVRGEAIGCALAADRREDARDDRHQADDIGGPMQMFQGMRKLLR